MQFIIGLFCIIATVARVSASDIYYCNSTVSCPEEYPCCSQYGTCGTGYNCMSNCNPMFSYSYDACLPEPVCKDLSTKFDNYTSKVAEITTFLGNVSDVDWLYTGTILDYDDENSMILAMPQYSGGSVLTSARDVWYGKVSVRMKTSHLAGVITAFILFSGVEDELDYEWVGTDLDVSQTNYYFEGTLDYGKSHNITEIGMDSFDDYHIYEIDWHEEYTTWSVDGVVGRTLYRNETWNETLQAYKYPQTPSRIHLSIWPGGNSTNAPGTIAWAGGEINWDATDITDPGYYYAIINEVNVTCYDPPSGTIKNGTESYSFMSGDSFLGSNVMISNKRYVLGSSKGTGLDLDAGVSSVSSATTSQTSTSTKSSSTSTHSTDSSSSQQSTTSVGSSSASSASSASSRSASSSSSRVSSANLGSSLQLNKIVGLFSIFFGLIF